MPSPDRSRRDLCPPAGTPRARLLAVGLLGLMVAAVGYTVVRPLASLVLAGHEEAAVLEARLEGYRRIVGRRAALEAELSGLEARPEDGGDYLHAATPALAGAALQARIADLVRRHGGRVTRQQALPESDEAGFRRIAAQVRLTADITGLRTLLHALEDGRPRLFADGLSVRPQGGAGRLDVSLTVYGYLEAVR